MRKLRQSILLVVKEYPVVLYRSLRSYVSTERYRLQVYSDMNCNLTEERKITPSRSIQTAFDVLGILEYLNR